MMSCKVEVTTISGARPASGCGDDGKFPINGKSISIWVFGKRRKKTLRH